MRQKLTIPDINSNKWCWKCNETFFYSICIVHKSLCSHLCPIYIFVCLWGSI